MGQSFVVYSIIFLLGMFVLLLAFFLPKEPKKEIKCLEKFIQPPSNFLIFNYFPNHHIKIDAIQNGNKYVLADKIKPQGTSGLTIDQVAKYLTTGTMLKIYLIDSKGNSQHYADYFINTERNERIKNLHVGMVTSRFIYNSSDGLHMATTHANAGQGNAWLVIHNVTAVPLSLNDGEITVPPNSTYRYLGYLNQGVTLGTFFKDDDGIYPEYQYLRPHSDLYYGITSDIRQPLLGCMQYGEFSDECDYGDTLWPFQEGVI
jgi:hypothetical protein